jgi:6-phosphogluconolactonase
MAMTDPSGKFVYIPCKGSDHIAQYRLDAQNGKLVPLDPPTAPTAAGAGPRHMAFHPNGKYAYVIMELNNTLARYTFDAAKGTLSDPKTAPTLPKDFAGKNTTAHVLVSPDGRFVYGSNRGHNSIAIFAVNAADGAPEVLGHETGGGEIKTPRNFTLDLNGRNLLVASQSGDCVTVFQIDGASGLLKKLSGQPTTLKPSFVGVLPRP